MKISALNITRCTVHVPTCVTKKLLMPVNLLTPNVKGWKRCGFVTICGFTFIVTLWLVHNEVLSCQALQSSGVHNPE